MATTAADAFLTELTYPELLDRKSEIQERLQVIQIDDAPSKQRKPKGKKGGATSAAAGIPYTPKSDTHWDFVMKEMMWLGADFQGERKRQVSLAKKCASSIKQFHKTKGSK